MRRVVLLACLSLNLAACTHTMRVKNLDAYVKDVPPAHPLTIVLEDRSANPDEHEYFTFVREALATHAGVKSVLLASEAPPEVVPDVTVGVHPRPAYHGSWWNYPITFPGFILFTHAWNGFVYSADLDTEITVHGNDQAVTTREIDTRYRMRHCNFKRGALTSSGWYTPGCGGLNAVIGFFMVRYDDASTPEFRKEVRSAYGSYIANSIVELVNGQEVRRGDPDRGASLPADAGFTARCG